MRGCLMKTSSVYNSGDGTQWAAEQPEVDLSLRIIQITLIKKGNFSQRTPKIIYGVDI